MVHNYKTTRRPSRVWVQMFNSCEPEANGMNSMQIFTSAHIHRDYRKCVYSCSPSYFTPSIWKWNLIVPTRLFVNCNWVTIMNGSFTAHPRLSLKLGVLRPTCSLYVLPLWIWHFKINGRTQPTRSKLYPVINETDVRFCLHRLLMEGHNFPTAVHFACSLREVAAGNLYHAETEF